MKKIIIVASSVLAFAACSHDPSAQVANAEQEQAQQIDEANRTEARLAADQAKERQDLNREHRVEAAQGSGSGEEFRRERTDLAVDQAKERAETRGDSINEVASATTNLADAKIDLAADKVKFREEILARLEKVELRAGSAIEKAKVSAKSNVVKNDVVKGAQELQSTVKTMKTKLPEMFKDATDSSWTATKADTDAQVDTLEDRLMKLEGAV